MVWMIDYSEYIAQCDERRAFISGFTGSAGATCLFCSYGIPLLIGFGSFQGVAIVTRSDAFLFSDGRYFLQAEKQLDQ